MEFKKLAMAAMAASMAVCGAVGFSFAQAPKHGVEIVVGASPGGGDDATARAVEAAFNAAKLVGQPLNVNYRPGAGGTVAVAYINNYRGDMHYLNIAALNLITNHLQGTSPLGPADVTPLAALYTEYLCFAAHPKGKLQTAKDLIEALKKDASALRFGFGTAAGNHNQIAFAALAEKIGIDPKKPRTVIFPGAADATSQLLGQHVDFVVAPARQFASYHKAGELKCLAVTAPERFKGDLADVPTLTELGYDVTAGSWRIMIAPGGVKGPELAFWEDAFKKMMDVEAWKVQAEKNYWSVNYRNHEDTLKFLEAESKQAASALKALGLLKN